MAKRVYKQSPNMAKVVFGYSNEFVMPMKHALAILEAFEHAEKYDKPYDKPIVVQPIEENMVVISTVSNESVIQGRLQYILGISDQEECKE